MRRATLASVASLLLVHGCHLDEGADLRDVAPAVDGGEDGGRAPGDARADSELDSEPVDGGDAAVDGSLQPRPGPLTFVARRAGLSAERLCDFDGDGLFDNAVAELGTSEASLFVAAVNSVVQSSIDQGFRWLTHAPLVDDVANLTDPEMVAMLLVGCEGECLLPEPGPEAENDFDGDASFYAQGAALDQCGEPVFYSEGATLERGSFEGFAREIPLLATQTGFAIGREATIFGRIERGAREGEFEICSYSTIADLAEVELVGLPGENGAPHLLSLMLAGGAALGLSVVPGIQPDVDLDGDGLERLFLDEALEISRCLDGDGTPIEGPDCWSDERIADAFATTAWQQFVSARFAGLHWNWRSWARTECTEEPETSLFDPR